MSTDRPTDDGAEPTVAGPRVCPDCQGFGVWHGDRDDGQLVVECATCGHHWTAPDRAGRGDGQ